MAEQFARRAAWLRAMIPGDRRLKSRCRVFQRSVLHERWAANRMQANKRQANKRRAAMARGQHEAGAKIPPVHFTRILLPNRFTARLRQSRKAIAARRLAVSVLAASGGTGKRPPTDPETDRFVVIARLGQAEQTVGPCDAMNVRQIIRR